MFSVFNSSSSSLVPICSVSYYVNKNNTPTRLYNPNIYWMCEHPKLYLNI